LTNYCNLCKIIKIRRENVANTTKRVLAMSLKKLLTHMPLDKITIQNLVDDAEVSRKTFYYHFQDIYDLLEWILIDDGKRLIEGRDTVDTWQDGLKAIFDYFQENRAITLNVYRSLHEDNKLLEQHVTRLVMPNIEKIFNAQPNSEKVSPEDKELILQFYSVGLIKLFLHWISDGMKPDADHLINKLTRLFKGSMESLIMRCLE